ncbi:unnamed protein product [Urochloa decumbens]|uniref:F-box domain-containing protein n=1 Tax=Urochloa decumbens TaxID=240449 RepID=A0ABC8VW32_9POAL
MEAAAAAKRARGSAPDRLSALSDELVCHVLSFLPSRQAVQTTVLSKRWMDLCRSCLDAFRLDLHCATSDLPDLCRDAERWFRRGIPRLGSELRRLKRLEFQGVSLDSRFSERLSSGCPVLEDMVLHTYPYQFSERIEAIFLGSVFNVTSLELQSFQAMAIMDKELDNFTTFDNLRTLSLNLCFLSNRDANKFKALGRFLQKSPNLEKLILKNFWYSEAIVSECRSFDYTRLEMLKPVVGPIEFPMLENLRTLVLVKCDLRDKFRLLCHLLRSSPNLEKLTLQCCDLRAPRTRSYHGAERKSQAEEDTFWVSEPCSFPMSKAEIY